MILYHGGTDIVEKPEIILPLSGRDFGKGFYCTDIPEQVFLPFAFLFLFDGCASGGLNTPRQGIGICQKKPAFYSPSIHFITEKHSVQVKSPEIQGKT
jgi:hypothetical protein